MKHSGDQPKADGNTAAGARARLVRIVFAVLVLLLLLNAESFGKWLGLVSVR